MKATPGACAGWRMHFGPAEGKPRDRFRLVLRPAGQRHPDLGISTCRRTPVRTALCSRA